MNTSFTLKLSDPSATLEMVGGKGLSLAKMIGAGFPVPDGFHITTEAYRQFIAANNLQAQIFAALKDVDPAVPSTLEAAPWQSADSSLNQKYQLIFTQQSLTHTSTLILNPKSKI